jgi:hypothetical protein
MIETGDVAEPGDPHLLRERTVAGERLHGRDDAVSAPPKRLWHRRLDSGDDGRMKPIGERRAAHRFINREAAAP